MKLLVPATTTNFASGFDTFGLALNLYNEFEVEESNKFSVEIEGEGNELPKDENNLVIKVYKRCCEIFKEEERPFKLIQRNKVPVERGLGSSATAIVGGIEIFCKLHKKELSVQEKLNVAFEFESHPDNLLPAFVGGFVICVKENKNLIYQKLKFPEDLTLIFAVPDFKVSTEKARKVLPENVSLKDAVFNIQRASLFVSSILTGRYELIRYALEDKLHEPFRKRLIKGFDKVKESAYKKGALGVFISGSGPTVCAIAKDNEEEIGKSMKEAFKEEDINAYLLFLKGSERGAFWMG